MADAIEMRGLEPILAMLNRLGHADFVNPVLTAGGVYLARKVAVYPPKKRPTRASVYGRAFKTERQRKFFFAARADGRIDVPYRRGISSSSQTLGKRWTVYSQSKNVVVVGNNATYARLVQSLQDQSLYMRAVGWIPVETTLERERANILKYMERELEREVKRAGG